MALLFGSTVEGKATSLSDVDIGIVFKKLPTPKETLAIYQEIYGLLTDVLLNQKFDIVLL